MSPHALAFTKDMEILAYSRGSRESIQPPGAANDPIFLQLPAFTSSRQRLPPTPPWRKTELSGNSTSRLDQPCPNTHGFLTASATPWNCRARLGQEMKQRGSAPPTPDHSTRLRPAFYFASSDLSDDDDDDLSSSDEDIFDTHDASFPASITPDISATSSHSHSLANVDDDGWNADTETEVANIAVTSSNAEKTSKMWDQIAKIRFEEAVARLRKNLVSRVTMTTQSD